MTRNPASTVVPPILLVILLTLIAPPVAYPADDPEDLQFGCSLIDQGFPDLGVQYLDPRAQLATQPTAQLQVYSSLASGNEDLAQAPTLTDDQRAAYEQAAAKYWDLLIKVSLPEPKDIDTALAIRSLAERIDARLPRQKDKTRADALRTYTGKAFKLAIAALEKEVSRIEHEMEQEGLTEAQDLELQSQYLTATIKLAFTRYRYFSFLPTSDPQRRALADQIQTDLRYIIYAYQEWPDTLYACELLSQLRIDIGSLDDAALSAQEGLNRIASYVQAAPTLAPSLEGHKDDLTALYLIASARNGKFPNTLPPAKSLRVQAAVAEVYLLHARSSASDTVAAQNHLRKANTILETLDKTPEGRREADRLRTLYADLFGKPGLGDALQKWDTALRARNYTAVIPAGENLVRFGLKGGKRYEVLNNLAYAFTQTHQYAEAAIIYRSLSDEQGDNEETSDKLARIAVNCVKLRADLTKDPVDTAIYKQWDEWYRKEHGGPDKEYEDALAAQRSGDYDRAIAAFARVPKNSTYHETTLIQLANCHLALARKTITTDPNDSATHLAETQKLIAQFNTEITAPNTGNLPPRIKNLRNSARAVALLLQTRIDLWENKNDYQACLDRTENLAEKCPNAPRFYPALYQQRIQALIGLKRPDDALAEFNLLLTAAETLPDDKETAPVITQCVSAIFYAYQAQAKQFTDENKTDLAQQAKTKALDLVAAAIQKDKNQAYEWYRYAIVGLDEAKRFRETLDVAQLFFTQYAGKQWTPQQAAEIKMLEYIRAKAFFQNGQYPEAVTALRAYTTSSPPDDLNLMYAKLYLAKSLRAVNTDKTPVGDEALKLCIELLQRLTVDAKDSAIRELWWDAAATRVEIANTLKQYNDTTWWIPKYIAGREDTGIGGPEIRQRFVSALEFVYRNSSSQDERDKALDGILTIRRIETNLLIKDAETLKGEPKSAKLRQAIAIVKDFSLFDRGYGGEKGKKAFTDILNTIRQKADNPDVIREIDVILKDISTS